MSAEKFEVSYVAAAQMALLTSAEKAALARLFSTDEIEHSQSTRETGDGRFASLLESKLILWNRTADHRPQILSIVDRSYAQA